MSVKTLSALCMQTTYKLQPQACTCKHALGQPILYADGNIPLQAACHFLRCLNCPKKRAAVYLAYVFVLHADVKVNKSDATCTGYKQQQSTCSL